MQEVVWGWSLLELYGLSKGKQTQPKVFRWEISSLVRNSNSQGVWLSRVGVGSLLIMWTTVDMA